MAIRRNPPPSQKRGFSLIELAVVMAIVAFLLGGLTYTLSAQVDQRNFEETRRRLDQARELILAFAITNGRLPCPARSVATAAPVTVPGDEVLTTTGTVGCIGDAVTDFYGGTAGGVTYGLLPARAIGYQQVDASGFAVDAWGNRIRYAVSGATPANCAGTSTMPHFFSSTNLKQNGISCQPSDLLVCKSATGITATACGGATNQIMTQDLLAVIIFSTGKNGAGAAGGIDEAANLNGDRIFVYHTPTPTTAANGEFDDQFTWITYGELYGKMIAAGVLP
ncbi:MAG TPA: type II secretion system protein [Burkholderiales bacterium]|nr:type II secretion system protein [Burkholderiales bacterium]